MENKEIQQGAKTEEDLLTRAKNFPDAIFLDEKWGTKLKEIKSKYGDLVLGSLLFHAM